MNCAGLYCTSLQHALRLVPADARYARPDRARVSWQRARAVCQAVAGHTFAPPLAPAQDLIVARVVQLLQQLATVNAPAATLAAVSTESPRVVVDDGAPVATAARAAGEDNARMLETTVHVFNKSDGGETEQPTQSSRQCNVVHSAPVVI